MVIGKVYVDAPQNLTKLTGKQVHTNIIDKQPDLMLTCRHELLVN